MRYTPFHRNSTSERSELYGISANVHRAHPRYSPCRVPAQNTDFNARGAGGARDNKPVGRRFAIRAAIAAALAATSATVAGAWERETAEASSTPGSIWYSSGLPTSTGSTATIEGDNTDATGHAIGVYGNAGTNGIGVQGISSGLMSGGVLGQSANGGVGVAGQSSGSLSNGVFGYCSSGTGSVGTWGAAETGAIGQTGLATGTGVLGLAGSVNQPASPLAAGVVGLGGTHTGVLGSTISTTNAALEGDGVTIGVQGISVTTGTTTGYGVIGRANNGTGSAGILGTSTSGYGFYGFSSAAGSASFVPAGILGYSTQTSGAGLIAYNGGAGTGYAAIFGGPAAHSGNVLIRGTLTTLNSAPSVAARDAVGALRRLYGVQSPESWFEDFGSGQLVNGSATLPLDPDFAQLISADSYHVFLTPESDCNGLYVSAKSAGSFTVRELRSGTGNSGGKPGGESGVVFSYRIVARSAELASARLEQVAEPPAFSPPSIPDLRSEPVTPTEPPATEPAQMAPPRLGPNPR